MEPYKITTVFSLLATVAMANQTEGGKRKLRKRPRHRLRYLKAVLTGLSWEEKHPPTCLRGGGGGSSEGLRQPSDAVAGAARFWWSRSPRRTAAPLLLHFLEENKHRRHCGSRTLGAFFPSGLWTPLRIPMLLLRNNLLLMGAAEGRRPGQGHPAQR